MEYHHLYDTDTSPAASCLHNISINVSFWAKQLTFTLGKSDIVNTSDNNEVTFMTKNGKDAAFLQINWNVNRHNDDYEANSLIHRFSDTEWVNNDDRDGKTH